MTDQNDLRPAAQAMDKGDYEEAVRLLRPLAEQNSEYALLTLGWIYETGATGTPDKVAARSLYEQAFSQGSADACLYLGCLLLKEGHQSEARKAFERGVQFNNDECKAELARLTDYSEEKLASQALENGAYDEAVRLLRPLADRNSPFALLSLGLIYERGVSGVSDKEVARSYFERAASQGSAAAYFELGRLLKKQGEVARARAAFEAGAERGHLPSMFRLATMMINGRGGPIDFETGTSWLEKAAANGHIYARRKLLAIQAHNAKSIFDKVAVKIKTLALMIRGSKEIFKDPSSDKVR